MGNKKKIRAFTIAEIVVAMMVLSAISMILIPVIMNDSKEKVLETSLIKTYTLLQQATQSAAMQSAQGRIQLTGNPQADLTEAFKANMKVVDDDKIDEFIHNYSIPDRANTIILKNGVFIFVKPGAVDLLGNVLWTEIVIDVNGNKLPNENGTDIFYFRVDSNDNVYSISPYAGCTRDDDKTCEAAKKLKLNKI